MSHFTSIETQIRDPAALLEACRELGVELLLRPLNSIMLQRIEHEGV